MARKLVICPRKDGVAQALVDVLWALEASPQCTPLVHMGWAPADWGPAGRADVGDLWHHCFSSPAAAGEVVRRAAGQRSKASALPAEALDAAIIGLGDPVPVSERRGPDWRPPLAGDPGTAPGSRRRMLGELLRCHVRVRQRLVQRAERLLLRLGEGLIGVCYPGPASPWSSSWRRPVRGAQVSPAIDDYLDALPPGAAPVLLWTNDPAARAAARRRLGFRLRTLTPLSQDAPLPARWERQVVELLLLARSAHLVHGCCDLAAAALSWNSLLPATDVTALQQPEYEGAIVLSATAAARYGATAAEAPLREPPESLRWGDRRDYLGWNVEVGQDLLCRVDLRYGCDPGAAGTSFHVGVEGGERVTGRVASTGGWGTACWWAPVGWLPVQRGRRRLTLRSGPEDGQKGDSAVMNLWAVRLVPAGR